MKRRHKTNEKSNVTEIILPVIAIIIGICVIVGISIKRHNENKISVNYSETQGTIVDYNVTKRNNSERIGKKDTIYWPIVEYTVDGNTYQIVSEYGSKHKRKNNQMLVKYNPDNPEDAIVSDGEGPNAFFVVAFLFVSMGTAMLLGKAKNKTIQMSGMLLGSLSAFLFLCGILYLVKGTENSWNPISIIKSNPVAIMVYLLIIVAVYVIIYSLWAMLLSESKGTVLAECIEIRDYTQTKVRVFFQKVTKNGKKNGFFCITIQKENNQFIVGRKYLADFSCVYEAGKMKETVPYGKVEYFSYLNEQHFQLYYDYIAKNDN